MVVEYIGQQDGETATEEEEAEHWGCAVVG